VTLENADLERIRSIMPNGSFGDRYRGGAPKWI
jgi:hypothetical protein